MKSKILLLIALIAATTIFGSCRKNCRCYGYDGDVVDYSRSEVKEQGNSCAGMQTQGGIRFYSICEWDN